MEDITIADGKNKNSNKWNKVTNNKTEVYQLHNIISAFQTFAS